MSREELINKLHAITFNPLSPATQWKEKAAEILEEWEAAQWIDCSECQPELGAEKYRESPFDPQVERKSIPVVIEDSKGHMYVGNYYYCVVEGDEEYGWESSPGYDHFCIPDAVRWRHIPRANK